MSQQAPPDYSINWDVLTEANIEAALDKVAPKKVEQVESEQAWSPQVDIAGHVQRDSPLLALPVEIRMSIWRYVLGDRLLHIRQAEWDEVSSTFAKHHSWCIRECINERSPWELYQLFLAAETYDFPKQGYRRDLHDLAWASLSSQEQQKFWRECRADEFTHRDCTDMMRGRRYGRSATRENPAYATTLNLLLTCRMVLAEARHLPWTTNTFSFDDARSFIRFFGQRTKDQISKIGKLHLKLRKDYRWTAALSKRFVNLHRLDELHIHQTIHDLAAYAPNADQARSQISDMYANMNLYFKQKTSKMTLIIDTTTETPHDLRVSWSVAIQNHMLSRACHDCQHGMFVLNGRLNIRSDQRDYLNRTHRMFVCTQASTRQECATRLQAEWQARGGRHDAGRDESSPPMGSPWSTQECNCCRRPLPPADASPRPYDLRDAWCSDAFKCTQQVGFVVQDCGARHRCLVCGRPPLCEMDTEPTVSDTCPKPGHCQAG